MSSGAPYVVVLDSASFPTPTNITIEGGGLSFEERTDVLNFYGNITGDGLVARGGTMATGDVHFKGKLDLSGIYGLINVNGGSLYLDNEFSASQFIVGPGKLVVAANKSPSKANGSITVRDGVIHLANDAVLEAFGGTIARRGFLSGSGVVTKGEALSVMDLGKVAPGAIDPISVNPEMNKAEFPANGIGTLKFEGASGGNSVALASGAKYIVDLDGTAKKADLLSSLGGNIVINAGALLEIDAVYNSSSVKDYDEFTIAEIATGADGEITGAFGITTYNINGIDFDLVKLDESGDPVANLADPGKKLILRGPGTPPSIPLAVAVVPEPSTYALSGGFGALAFALWRRKRKKSGVKRA